MKVHFNSVGKGKGIATYYNSTYTVSKSVTSETYQMTRVSSEFEDIINVYRSECSRTSDFIKSLISMINVDLAVQSL